MEEECFERLTEIVERLRGEEWTYTATDPPALAPRKEGYESAVREIAAWIERDYLEQ